MALSNKCEKVKFILCENQNVMDKFVELLLSLICCFSFRKEEREKGGREGERERPYLSTIHQDSLRQYKNEEKVSNMHIHVYSLFLSLSYTLSIITLEK